MLLKIHAILKVFLFVVFSAEINKKIAFPLQSKKSYLNKELLKGWQAVKPCVVIATWGPRCPHN